MNDERRSVLLTQNGDGRPQTKTKESNSYLNAVLWQFMRICSTADVITFDTRVSNLACNVSVAEAYNQTIFWCVVLVLVLENQTFPGVVIGFTFATPLEFDLITLEVLLVLDNLNETLEITNVSHYSIANITSTFLGYSGTEIEISI